MVEFKVVNFRAHTPRKIENEIKRQTCILKMPAPAARVTMNPTGGYFLAEIPLGPDVERNQELVKAYASRSKYLHTTTDLDDPMVAKAINVANESGLRQVPAARDELAAPTLYVIAPISSASVLQLERVSYDAALAISEGLHVKAIKISNQFRKAMDQLTGLAVKASKTQEQTTNLLLADKEISNLFHQPATTARYKIDTGNSFNAHMTSLYGTADGSEAITSYFQILHLFNGPQPAHLKKEACEVRGLLSRKGVKEKAVATQHGVSLRPTAGRIAGYTRYINRNEM